MSERTLAQEMQGAGYRTALMGKWHLGNRTIAAEVASDEANAAEVRKEGGYGWASDVYYDNDAMDRAAHQPEWMAVS